MIYTLLISLWFASFNANRICSIGYYWVAQRHRTNQSTNCQNYKVGELKTKSLAKLITTFPEEPLMKWGFDLIGLI
jgi:hypothetical protein